MASIDSLVLSKSLALLEKTRRRVEQIDTAAFPTESSGRPRELLLASLKSLADEAHWKAMSAESLYNTLIRLQDLVAEVEASTSDDISWPLVSYCDHFWNLLFPKKDALIFYSVFKQHNFCISSFSAKLRSLLDTLLPPVEINNILGLETVYCLQISSLETENLPLYAVIGHEFGHALYWLQQKQIVKIVSDEFATVFGAMAADLRTGGSPTSEKRCGRLIIGIAMELFCDLVGILVAGPAFILRYTRWGGVVCKIPGT